MSIYIGVAIYYLIMSFIESGIKKTEKSNKLFSFIALTPLFFLTALRGTSVGTDTIQYQRVYDYIYTSFSSLQNHVSRMEIGYRFLNCLCNELGMSYFQFQFFVSLLIFVSFFCLIENYSSNAHFACYLLVTFRIIFSIMNISRSWIATSLFLLVGIPLLKKQKLVAYIVFIILDAFLFHTSIIICLLLYPLVTGRITKQKISFFLFGAIVAMIAGQPVILFVVRFLGKYSDYVNNSYDETGSAVLFTLALHTCFFVFSIMKNKRLLTDFRSKNLNQTMDSLSNMMFEDRLLFMSTILVVALDIVGLRLNIMNRLSVHIMPLFILDVVNSLKKIRLLSNKLIVGVVVSAVAMLYFYIILVYRSNWNNVIPYIWYWKY